MRLDAYLQSIHPDISRAQLQKLIKDSRVRLNGQIIKKTGLIVKSRDRVDVDMPVIRDNTDSDLGIQIIHEDSDCIVIIKPVGLLSHSKGAFNPEPTVYTWLKRQKEYNFADHSENNRNGIVHRLDRATSGVMICAKNEVSQKHLQKQFQDRKAKKRYVARVEGVPEPVKALIDLPIERNPKKPQSFRVGANGKTAQTEYSILETIETETGTHSLLLLLPHTGRTHQLRVHLNYVKHPIIGDTFYGGAKAARLFLHASELEITLPSKDRKTFTAEVPKIFYEKVLR